MAILSSCSSSNCTAGTTCNCIVYDIDDISEGKSNRGESVTEPDTHMTTSRITGHRINLGCQKISIAFQILIVTKNLTNKVSFCLTTEIV